MRGKQTCKILKEIRQKIADENEIEFVTSECHYKGECLGTCPKCEAELRYLEQELGKRQSTGELVTLAGLSLVLAGCVNDLSNKDMKNCDSVPTVDSSDIVIVDSSRKENVDSDAFKTGLIVEEPPAYPTQEELIRW